MKRAFVLAVVVLVSLWDVAMGFRLLLLPSPERAHGEGTVWTQATAISSMPAIASLYQRLGAFSLQAGIATLVFAAVGARHRPTLSALLLTYAVTGIGFLINDWTYFRGTPYFVIKQCFGALWFVALLLHFTDRPRSDDSSAVS
ncbi:MAG: hypothetical protein ACXVEF_06100 [Polyangiales bacterium]